MFTFGDPFGLLLHVPCGGHCLIHHVDDGRQRAHEEAVHWRALEVDVPLNAAIVFAQGFLELHAEPLAWADSKGGTRKRERERERERKRERDKGQSNNTVFSSHSREISVHFWLLPSGFRM